MTCHTCKLAYLFTASTSNPSTIQGGTQASLSLQVVLHSIDELKQRSLHIWLAVTASDTLQYKSCNTLQCSNALYRCSTYLYGQSISNNAIDVSVFEHVCG